MKLNAKTDVKLLSKTHKQDLLMTSLQKFYKKHNNINIFLKIVNGNSKISLRIIDWFVTNYSKKNNTNYNLLNFNCDVNEAKFKQFIVYIDYKLQLKGYSKKQFDPFQRRERINFYYTENKFITTTVGQLNFFRWAIKHKVINYIENNIEKIEKDMNKSYKAVYNKGKKKGKNNRRRRQELSLSATRTVNKHNVKIVVSFD